MKPQRSTSAQLQRRIDDWNMLYPEGTPVQVTKDNGDKHMGLTRSRAEILSGHSAVIWVTGIAGCYALDRVQPITKVAQAL